MSRVVPETDHEACVVDILARRGYLEEAGEMANRYRTCGMTNESSEAVLERVIHMVTY
ncbi:hypothetical protein Hdeb2414_s0007g00244081 [Helianthus debilis subsp. tardiflorus]